MMRGRGYPAGQSFNRGAISQSVDDGIVILKHREFVGTLNSSVDFQTQTYDLNPGLDETMPWAAGIANQFQQYKVRSMCWEFVSTAATSLVSGTNTALGQVAIATQYDSVTPPFTNLADMLNSQWATSTKISENLLHPIESEKGQTTSMPQYIRNAPPPPNADIRLYDLGRTTIATYGAQAANQIGQIWISYEIALFKPVSTRQSGGSAEGAFFTNTAIGVGQSFASGRWLGTASTTNWDSIGITFSLVPINPQIIFPVGASGYYFVQLAWFPTKDAGLTWRTGGVTATNGTVVSDFYRQAPPPAFPGPQIYAGNNALSGGVGPNFAPSFFVYIADPERQCVLTLDSAWSLPLADSNSDILNILVCQMYSGAQQFAAAADAEPSCCALLQVQVDELTELVRRCCDEEHKDEELDHEVETVEEALLNLVPPLVDPEREAERQALLAQLAALLAESDPPDEMVVSEAAAEAAPATKVVDLAADLLTARLSGRLIPRRKAVTFRPTSV